MFLLSRLFKHCLLWCGLIAAELATRSLVARFGTELLPAVLLKALQDYVGWLLGGTFIVSATMMIGEVIMYSLGSSIREAVLPLLESSRDAAQLYGEIRKILRGIE